MLSSPEKCGKWCKNVNDESKWFVYAACATSTCDCRCLTNYPDPENCQDQGRHDVYQINTGKDRNKTLGYLFQIYRGSNL